MPSYGQGAGFNMPLAIIGLVCLEARVKFKNIDFRTQADFACYCMKLRIDIFAKLRSDYCLMIRRQDNDIRS